MYKLMRITINIGTLPMAIIKYVGGGDKKRNVIKNLLYNVS